MNISFSDNDTNVVFKISDFPEEYNSIFQNCFYKIDVNNYIKEFPKGITGIEKIEANYLKYAEEMFAQVGYFKSIPWEDALLAFIKKVEASNINWWLTGSCATCIRGIPLNPHDIDIMLDAKDIEKVNLLFEENIIEPIIDTKWWVTDYFGVAFLGARVDLAFNPHESLDEPEPADSGPYAMKNLEEYNWKGYKIKIPPLELQLSTNRKRGRFDRAKQIEEFINNSASAI